MPRISFRQGTIYNGTTFNERVNRIRPALGMTMLGRNFNADETRSFGRVGNISVVDHIENKRVESMLKMHAMSQRHSDILFQARTVFPFDLFPDTLTISATKIELRVNSFFYSYNTVTIPLQDIGHIELEKGPFFSTLNIINIRADKPITVRYLWNYDALRGKKLINGLLIAQEAGVDVSVIEAKKLLDQLERLGT